MKQIACFQFTSNRIQVIASLEILKTVRNDFGELRYFWLGNNVLYPSKMAQHSFSFNKRSQPRYLKNLLRKLNFNKFYLSTNLDYNQLDFWKAFSELSSQLSMINSISNLGKLNFNGIKPGPAIANTLAFEYQTQDLDLSRFRDITNLLMKSYLEVYFHTILFLKSNSCQNVLIYNGRFLHERAVWDACISLNIDILIFETTRNRYHVRKNTGFHNRVINQHLMIEHWQNDDMPLEKKNRLGSRYFETLESNRNSHFTVGKSIEPTFEKYLAFFSNSDDEAVGFWDSWSNNGMSQTDVVKFLCEISRANGFGLIVRLHPNLKSKPQTEQQKWEFIHKFSNITVFDQFSDSSSYEIMKKSAGVISFGSTIGLEAAFHSIPSLVLADCWYDLLGAVDKADSLDGLMRWIKKLPLSQEVLENRKGASLVRGFWLETAGSKFQDAVMSESTWGAWDVIEYRGVLIKPKRFFDIWHIALNRLARWHAGLPRR